MAVGGALLFNIRLPNNFNSPYRALSVQDFWRRWHMTLSRFLRDYVYIRLGGNRRGTARTYFNLFVTFLLGGLWHGAGWTFIAWGALHGGALVVHRLWERLGLRMHAAIAWFLCFNFINIAWVFFRAEDFESASRVLRAMFGGDLVLPPAWQAAVPSLGRISEAGPWLNHIYADGGLLVGLIVAMTVAVGAPNSQQWMERLRFNPRTALVTAGIFVGAVTNLTHVTEFLYFNF
jgi:D-alanyl-lipoteichoic acid acyltransferase DltB (MBOAT superfamily)